MELEKKRSQFENIKNNLVRKYMKFISKVKHREETKVNLMLAAQNFFGYWRDDHCKHLIYYFPKE